MNVVWVQCLRVFIAGRSEEKLQDIVRLIQNVGGRATLVVADIALELDFSLPV